MGQIVIKPGAAKVAKAPIDVNPAGIECEAELWIGVNQTTKAASSGKIPFTSVNGAQTISFPITMPVAGGLYHVYLDIYIDGTPYFGFVGTDDIVIITGSIGPITWT